MSTILPDFDLPPPRKVLLICLASFCFGVVALASFRSWLIAVPLAAVAIVIAIQAYQQLKNDVGNWEILAYLCIGIGALGAIVSAGNLLLGGQRTILHSGSPMTIQQQQMLILKPASQPRSSDVPQEPASQP